MLQPVVQYGFLGFAAVLLGIVVWLVRCLLAVLRETNRIIEANTQVIANQTAKTDDLLKLSRQGHDLLISRPCMALSPGRR